MSKTGLRHGSRADNGSQVGITATARYVLRKGSSGRGSEYGRIHRYIPPRAHDRYSLRAGDAIVLACHLQIENRWNDDLEVQVRRGVQPGSRRARVNVGFGRGHQWHEQRKSGN